MLELKKLYIVIPLKKFRSTFMHACVLHASSRIIHRNTRPVLKLQDYKEFLPQRKATQR